MANAFKREIELNIGTSVVTLGGYIVPASTQVTLIGMTIANLQSHAVTVTVRLFDGAATAANIVKDAPIPAGASLVVVGGDQKLVMETNDRIQVFASESAAVDAVMSLLEIT